MLLDNTVNNIQASFVMPRYAIVEDVIALIESGVRPPLVAIDGLPCSGKSTMVDRLRDHIELDCISLDDFVLPERDWPSGMGPTFPFAYIRYDEFLDAVQTLASKGTCSFRPFDWSTFEISADKRTVSLSKSVVVEGVSSLNPSLCNLYGLKIFIESDRASALQAAFDRGVGDWGDRWRKLFVPSADIYMATRPEERADLLIAGRGAVSKFGCNLTAAGPSPSTWASHQDGPISGRTTIKSI
jgi:uridine kinase